VTAGALVKKAFPTVTVSVLDSKDGSVRSLRSSVFARHSERREAACVAASQYHSTYIRTALQRLYDRGHRQRLARPPGSAIEDESGHRPKRPLCQIEPIAVIGTNRRAKLR
jgi:hypothetical protein